MGVTTEEEKKAKEGKTFSEEQLEAMNTMIGGAVASHLNRGKFKELLAGVVKETLGDVLPDVVKAAMPKPETTPEPKAKKGEGERELPAEWKQQFDSMALENKKLLDRLKAKEDSDKAREDNDRQSAERSAFEKHLIKAGVPAVQARAAALMKHTELAPGKRIKTSPSGEVMMTIKTSYGDEDVTVERGVEEFMKSDEGKAFLPAVAASGAGTLGGGGGRTQITPANGKPLSKEQKLANLATSLVNGVQ